MTKRMQIAILGAGFGGMAAAYDLARAGHTVTIYEAEDYVGGLASGFKQPGWNWSVEKFYHHWFASDSHMLGLLDELGLRHKAQFPRPYTVLYHNGEWHPFDSIAAAIKYPGLGWGLDKVRFGLVGLYLRLSNNWRGLERSTVDAWMRRWAGERVYKQMWEPLMVGKFGPYAKQVNMAWLWARLHARTTNLGTYEGGFQAFADDFAGILRGMGVDIQLGLPANEVVKLPGGRLAVTTGDSQTMAAYHRVLVTTSPGLLARLTPTLPGEYLKGLLGLKSMGAVVLTLALKGPVSPQGYYWYNIPKEAGFPFLALVEHTNFVPKENFGGQHIVYCGDYLESNHEYFNLTEQELLERFVPGIQRINPAFDISWVNKVWLHRTKYAQPVPLANHSGNIPAIRTPIEGLYFASMSQVYPWDRGTNFAVEIGRRAAREMLEDNVGG